MTLRTLLARWFGSRSSGPRADELARLFDSIAPAARKPGAGQQRRALEEVVAAAKGVQRLDRCGYVARSRIANGLRWRLVELGHPEELADEVARQVALAMTHAGPKPRSPA